MEKMYNIKEIANLINGKIIGNNEIKFTRLAPFFNANEEELAFAADEKMLKKIDECNAGAIIAPYFEGMPSNKTYIIVKKNPREIMPILLNYFKPKIKSFEKQIEDTAIIDKTAKVSKINGARNVDPKTGLTTEEVNKRLEKYGQNKLKGKAKKTLLQLFIAQLQDMLIYVLIAAAVINLIVDIHHGWTDALIIMAVVLINAVVGVVQESKAEKALEALQQMTTPKSLVRRNGEVIEVNSEDLVPGDILSFDGVNFIKLVVISGYKAGLWVLPSLFKTDKNMIEADWLIKNW